MSLGLESYQGLRATESGTGQSIRVRNGHPGGVGVAHVVAYEGVVGLSRHDSSKVIFTRSIRVKLGMLRANHLTRRYLSIPLRL